MANFKPSQNVTDGPTQAGSGSHQITGSVFITGSLFVNGVLITGSGGGSGSPGGANTQVQYNDGGLFGGDADFTWNDTTNVLTVNGNVSTDEVQLDTTYTATGHTKGRFYWDDDNKTVAVDMQGSDVKLQVGQEEHVYAKNTSGELINNGDAVRISGATGGNVNIEKAAASTISFTSSIEQDQILGIATEDIADNQSGYVTTFGAVRDLDTSMFNEGDLLYLSTTSGSYGTQKPTAPNFAAQIGIVQISDAVSGTILARPREPIFITDIAQVTGSGVIADGKSYLCYDDTSEIISFTDQFTGSFSGSFEGDGSSLISLAAGVDTQVQFNQNGELAGDSGFVYNGSGSLSASVKIEAPFFQNTYFSASINTDTNLSASLYNFFNYELGASVALTASSPVAGASYIIILRQDGTGNRVVSFDPATFKFPEGADSGSSTGAGEVDIVSGVSDGTVIYAAMNKKFV